MTRPVTTSELLLQQIADSNAEIVDLLRQGQRRPAAEPTDEDAPSRQRRSAKKATPQPRKGTEVRGD